MKPKLSIRNLFKVFGKSPDRALELLHQGRSKEEILEATGATVGVQDASFDVAEGEIFVIMGLSGSGKSTMVRMLNGLIPPTSGEILIDDEDIARCDRRDLRRIQREQITMVFQHFALFPHWSVVDNVAYGLKIKGVPAAERRARAFETLEQVGLAPWADSLPSELSGGMQQRVGLARGLATGAQILLMDEPFGALDPLIRREMQEELLTLQRSLKRTIVFITHDLNEALLLGERIAIMKDGRIVQIGTAQDIVAHPADDYVAAFVADVDRGRVFRARDVAGDPAAVQLGRHDVAEALRRMEKLNRNALYVLDGERIAGIVTYQRLAGSINGGTAEGAPLSDELIEEFPSIGPEDYLHDIYGKAGGGLPIAVTQNDRLVGVVEPDAVLAQLAANGEGDDAGAELSEQPECQEKEAPIA